MKVTEFRDGWQLAAVPRDWGFMQPHARAWPSVPARVPGAILDDLARAGLLPEPTHAFGDIAASAAEGKDFDYTLAFHWAPANSCPHRILEFAGLDTLATVWLNGVEIGRADNMFVPHRFDVSECLLPGENLLTVRIHDPEAESLRRRAEFCQSQGIDPATAFFDERAFLRKMQCAYGWDWGPRLITGGIWGPVCLLEFDEEIIHPRVQVTARAGGGFIVTLSAESPGEHVTTTFGGQQRTGPWPHVYETNLPAWQPRGYGAPHLHPATWQHATGHRVELMVGLRTVELIRERDEHGRSFRFDVNGERIWARGANWIPADILPGRVDPEFVACQLETLAELGVNMLRVWGGGLYESDAFYDACDRLGILVWQDFPFACSYYPDDERAVAEIQNEATYQIKRLRNRASLALWCGNNENTAVHEQRWGGEQTPPRFLGQHLFEDVLPRLVTAHNPETQYIASSPLRSPSEDSALSELGSWSDDHYWDVWHGRGDWVHYRDSRCRFSSEFGFASAAALPTWIAAGADPEGPPDQPILRWHDRTGKPEGRFAELVEMHYPQARTLAEWVVTSQLNQRDAMRTAIEHYRSDPACDGALIWQANDCWPAQSWSLIDARGTVKPAGFELARLFADLLICRRVDDAVIHYAGSADWTGELEETTFDGAGTILAKATRAMFVPAHGWSAPMPLPTVAEGCLMRWRLGNRPETDSWFIGGSASETGVTASPITIRRDGEIWVCEAAGLCFDLMIFPAESGNFAGYAPFTGPGPFELPGFDPSRPWIALSPLGTHELHVLSQ